MGHNLHVPVRLGVTLSPTVDAFVGINFDEAQGFPTLGWARNVVTPVIFNRRLLRSIRSVRNYAPVVQSTFWTVVGADLNVKTKRVSRSKVCLAGVSGIIST